MSTHNPDLQHPHAPSPEEAIQPNAPDFVETLDAPLLSEGHESFPVWLYLICGFCLFFAGSSFTGFNTFGMGLLDQGAGGPAITAGSGPQVAESTDPMVLGAKVYKNNCVSCHQADGMGSPGKYPPLAESEWVLGNKQRLASLVLHGLSGPVTVCSNAFPGAILMPPQAGTLSNDKLANLLTYIRASWGNKANPVTMDDVAAAAAKSASQSGPYSSDQLLKIAPNGADPSDK